MRPDAARDNARDIVRFHPEQQRRLVWSRTQPDGLTTSLSGGRLTLRRGCTQLTDVAIAPPAIAGVLASHGVSAYWCDQLLDAALLG